MNDSLIISGFSLIISIIALVISYIALQRDRYKVKVTWTPIVGGREISAKVLVRNCGKRPIDIVSISAQKPGQEGRSRTFERRPPGPKRIEEGQSYDTHIRSGDCLHVWDSLEELNGIIFTVEDALGKKYIAKKA